MGSSIYRRFALGLALMAFTLTSTVTAWASDCDTCNARPMSCCESATPAAQPSQNAKVSPTMPECCRTVAVGHCDGVRYDHDDAATSSTGIDLAHVATTPYVGPTEGAIRRAPVFVSLPAATAAPPRTTVLLL